VSGMSRSSITVPMLGTCSLGSDRDFSLCYHCGRADSGVLSAAKLQRLRFTWRIKGTEREDHNLTPYNAAVRTACFFSNISSWRGTRGRENFKCYNLST
jgi:hypothetical protein